MNTKELIHKMQGAKWYEAYDEALSYCIDKQAELDLDLGIIDSDYAEEIAKIELEKGGLLRLRFFLGDTQATSDYYRIDAAYGNLHDIDREDIECWLDEIAEAEEGE